MADILDSIQGIYHFLTDRIPDGLDTVPAKPRQHNIWRQDGIPVVAKVKDRGDVRSSVSRSLDLIGGIGKLGGKGDTIMVKPNFNSPDPPPGSTDLDFLRAVLELLLQTGARVVVGESSGGMWRPTRKTLDKLGVPQLLSKMGVEMIAFDDHPREWIRVDIRGDYLKTVTMPKSAYEATKLVYLPCLKTHNLGRFTMSLKLGMGLVHPGQRRAIHSGNLEQKAVEINLAWQPHLIIMDGRKAFVSGGPDKGDLVEPGFILASGDMVAIDVEGLKVLLSYRARNRIPQNPWDSPQIVTALRHRLGSKEGEYRVLSG
ncbi:MAG: DUF362 domain-containing protein [Dehalococcoidia bacterium]|nr:DUF362 domain-containing protein [Dehalococcoidia bacterium]